MCVEPFPRWVSGVKSNLTSDLLTGRIYVTVSRRPMWHDSSQFPSSWWILTNLLSPKMVVEEINLTDTHMQPGQR